MRTASLTTTEKIAPNSVKKLSTTPAVNQEAQTVRNTSTQNRNVTLTVNLCQVIILVTKKQGRRYARSGGLEKTVISAKNTITGRVVKSIASQILSITIAQKMASNYVSTEQRVLKITVGNQIKRSFL